MLWTPLDMTGTPIFIEIIVSNCVSDSPATRLLMVSVVFQTTFSLDAYIGVAEPVPYTL